MMMSKKKIIALAMSAVMAVGMIAGCGSTNNSTQCTLNLKTNIRTKSTFNL